MNRYKKKDLLQIVSSLIQVNDSITRAASSTVLFEAAEEFEKCQESAINLGNYFETLVDVDYTPLVSILEEYCENVYQMSINIRDDSQCRKLAKKVRKQLIQLQNVITYDLPPDKKEVVFLPYKASMWDSLESVWRAAQEDQNCEAHVIPIPYYDLNPDGSFREEHYEVELYPEEVPVTRYDAYDFEQRRPDIIYIHNAYDNWNLVTSVHPDFYSDKLKKYTEQLVYIPYFVLGEIDPDNELSIKNMKHFCFMPGIVNADKVVVQSENMKKIYVNEYLKAAKEQGLQGKHLDKTYLEQKFLGLGSPKYDKVLSTKKEDLVIPEEWQRVIEKPDGSWKKIILYNTGIAALLAHNEKWVDKIEDVLEIFRANQDEAALLWRPHPLIESTMKSMRPAVMEKYVMLKENYIAEGWGIYDDTADVDRAVVMSDAYYGDSSSIVYLFRKVGKKILIQKSTVRNREINPIALTEAIVEVDGYYWYVPLWKNALFRMNTKTFETEWMCFFRDEKVDLELYANIYVNRKELIFIPCKAKKIAIYNRLDNSIETIAFLEESYKKKDVYLYDWFMQYVVIDEKMYFIPCMYHSLICMDLGTKEISKIRVVNDSLDGEIVQISSTAAAVHEHKFYFVSEDENLVYAFDTQKQYLQKLSLCGKKYSGLFYIKKQLWLIPFNGAETLDVYDLENEKMVDRLQFPEKVIRYSAGIKGRCFSKGVIKDRKIYLLANLEVTSVVIDIEQRKIVEWYLPRAKYKDDACLNWIGLLESNNQLYAINGVTGEWAIEDNSQNKWNFLQKKATCTNVKEFQDDYAIENYGNIFGSRIEDLIEVENNFQIVKNINMGMEIYLATK